VLAFCKNSIHHGIVEISGLADLERFLRKHAGARGPMNRWIEIAEAADWESIIDARKSFPTADLIKETTLTVFNIAGNNYRLLTYVSYKRQVISIVELLTHPEYDRKYT
jgi:mRNA interferase HigB